MADDIEHADSGDADLLYRPHDDIAAVLGQSVSGVELLGPHERANIDRALEAGRAFKDRNPEAFARWEKWAEQNADNFGELLSRLARGEIPEGSPDEQNEEIAESVDRHRAMRELAELNQRVPPGTRQYLEPSHQRRVAALYRVAHGDEAIVGHNLRVL